MLDFGVAKLMQGTPEDLSAGLALNVTALGVVLGAPAYMAPEQCAARPLDGRTDIYTLGVVLFEVITGRQPFTSADYGELMIKHMTAEPPKENELLATGQHVPPLLENLILICMEKSPTDRPQTMD